MEYLVSMFANIIDVSFFFCFFSFELLTLRPPVSWIESIELALLSNHPSIYFISNRIEIVRITDKSDFISHELSYIVFHSEIDYY